MKTPVSREHLSRARLTLALLLTLAAFPPRAHCQAPAADQVIDLASALRLAGIDNREILIARQRVVESMALRQLAAAQLLPSLNIGINYDAHIGNLQQSDGNILKLNRDSLYVGAGAYAVGAGTVSIPGVVYNVNASQTIFDILVSRQEVVRRRFAQSAVQNEMLRRVSGAYLDLLRARGMRAIAVETQAEAIEIVRITEAWEKANLGRQSDAERTKTERDDRVIDEIDAEQKVNVASARLAELLSLRPLPRLRTAEAKLVPLPIVPEPIPLPELLAISMMYRPELAERRTAIRQALLELSAAKMLPFSPTLIAGFSAGSFGGGSDNAPKQPRFGDFDNRNDVDVVAYWTAQNMGLGNVALVRLAGSHVRSVNVEQVAVLNRVRSEVAQAQARVRVETERMAKAEQAVPVGARALKEEMDRIRGAVGLPIELLDSFRQLNRARVEYLEAIAAYNRAQVDLYAALGQPPAEALARPAMPR